MSGEKDLEQLKKEAVEKAKAAAITKRKALAAGETVNPAPTPVEQVKAEIPATSGVDDVDLAKKKAAAVAKAKAAAAAKRKAMELAGSSAPIVESLQPAPVSTDDEGDLAKKKAAAVAKAKAAAAAKRKAMELAGSSAPIVESLQPAPVSTDDEGDLAKKKAAAVAKAKAAAAAKRKAMELAGGSAPIVESSQPAPVPTADESDLAKKKAAAVAKAKAAAAAKSKAGAGDSLTQAAETKPSVNQPYLDKYVKVIQDNLGSDVLEDFYINRLSKDVPTLVVKRDTYLKVAQFLKYNELLGFDYLSELHGSDFETHMEIYVHLYSYKKRQAIAFKVMIDRDEPTIASLQPLWAGADWPECEAFDLLGIKFTGHPNLHRIMLGEDWVGHPLRKDYQPYDVEV